MPEPLKQFKNPPIKEAMFGIAFKEAVDGAGLVAFQETEYVKQRFPNVVQGMLVEASADAKTAQLTIAQKPDGYQLRSANENSRLLQVKTTQLTYHNLNRYDGWDTMISELKALWSEFCRTAGKTQLSQLSVRYINHIALPLPMEQGLGHYIKLLPQIPEGINPKLNNFFLQIHTPLTDTVHGTITETILNPEPGSSSLSVMLDLIVAKNGAFECNEAEMWEAFSELRVHKNDLFQKCLTPETLNSFDHE